MESLRSLILVILVGLVAVSANAENGSVGKSLDETLEKLVEADQALEERLNEVLSGLGALMIHLGEMLETRLKEIEQQSATEDAAIVSLLGDLEMRIRSGGACRLEEIGYQGSHYPDLGNPQSWCGEASFIGLIDLDNVGVDRSQNPDPNKCKNRKECPVIGRVLCCDILP